MDRALGQGLLLGLCGLVLAGCATTPPSPEALAANNPYEQTNRDALKLNAKIDKYFVIPTVDDAVIDPTNQIPIKQHLWWSGPRIPRPTGLEEPDRSNPPGYPACSVDYYSSLRNLYRQIRAEPIRNGRNQAQDLPDF